MSDLKEHMIKGPNPGDLIALGILIGGVFTFAVQNWLETDSRSDVKWQISNKEKKRSKD